MKQITYSTRQAKLSDLASLINLLEILFSIEEDFEFNPSHHKKALTNIITNIDCCCMVATNTEKEVIGMCCAQWVYSTASGQKSAWLEDMVIAPQHQNRGIGKQLIEATQNWALKQGCNRIQLVYDLANQPAIEFYKKGNFNQTQLGVFSKPL
ncbi:GNAT family N-acetyltransferase [Thiomicrorhabdus sp. Kp2]|uniref:GNAT family N-acetyltransferase n=1 Tax=Thiomicrorhabdus sp. Kp2 TaxID=1123518 RepID=UPI00041CEFEE|nr:GNAT family N-acetyltransferase [Thiomicrorhabdus sp. Kp2]